MDLDDMFGAFDPSAAAGNENRMPWNEVIQALIAVEDELI